MNVSIPSSVINISSKAFTLCPLLKKRVSSDSSLSLKNGYLSYLEIFDMMLSEMIDMCIK